MTHTEADIPRLNPARIEKMSRLLAAAFEPAELEITDYSHKHAGHGGGARASMASAWMSSVIMFPSAA